MIQRLIVALLVILMFSCSENTKSENESILRNNEIRIAFGSCAHSYDTLKIMNAVVSNDPKLWIWLGDIVYGDTHDMSVLEEKYKRQKNQPQYKELLKRTKVIGVWDDHDYGVNDAGKFYSKKDESKKQLLSFLDVAEDDPVRDHPGAYSQYDLEFANKLIKVILLDTRYFRDTLDPDLGTLRRYIPNEDGDILGEEQWSWLENVLRTSDADFHILGSGIQLIPEEQGYEKWANFPQARERMFKLIAGINPKPLIVISGDRHIAELSKIDLDGIDYPLYDFTSSGLTHTWGMYNPEANQYRVDSLIVAKNFGMINLSWEGNKTKAILEVRGESNELLQKTIIEF